MRPRATREESARARRHHRGAGALLLLATHHARAQSPAAGPNIPSTVYPPLCSIDPEFVHSHPRSTVLNVSDGTHARCVSVIIPGDGRNDAAVGPMPVLFDFHGAGGNAARFGRSSDSGMPPTKWPTLAQQYNFVVVGGEALQWSAGPPGPA